MCLLRRGTPIGPLRELAVLGPPPSPINPLPTFPPSQPPTPRHHCRHHRHPQPLISHFLFAHSSFFRSSLVPFSSLRPHLTLFLNGGRPGQRGPTLSRRSPFLINNELRRTTDLISTLPQGSFNRFRLFREIFH
jgi:hypothetical protein